MRVNFIVVLEPSRQQSDYGGGAGVHQNGGLPSLFHGLAAEQALQLAHPSFQLTDTARADDIFVSLDRLRAAFQFSSMPVE